MMDDIFSPTAEAWYAGYEAHDTGHSLRANPYSGASAEEWIAGWHQSARDDEIAKD